MWGLGLSEVIAVGKKKKTVQEFLKKATARI
jgi:hypothetical protein